MIIDTIWRRVNCYKAFSPRQGGNCRPCGGRNPLHILPPGRTRPVCFFAGERAKTLWVCGLSIPTPSPVLHGRAVLGPPVQKRGKGASTRKWPLSPGFGYSRTQGEGGFGPAYSRSNHAVRVLAESLPHFRLPRGPPGRRSFYGELGRHADPPSGGPITLDHRGRTRPSARERPKAGRRERPKPRENTLPTQAAVGRTAE